MKQLYNRSLSHPAGSERRGRNKGVDRRRSCGLYRAYITSTLSLRYTPYQFDCGSKYTFPGLPITVLRGTRDGPRRFHAPAVLQTLANISFHYYYFSGKIPSTLQFRSSLVANLFPVFEVQLRFERDTPKFPRLLRRTAPEVGTSDDGYLGVP